MIWKQAWKQTTGKQAGMPIVNDNFYIFICTIQLYLIINFAKKLKTKQYFLPFCRIAMIKNIIQWYLFSLPFLVMENFCINIYKSILIKYMLNKYIYITKIYIGNINL